MVDPAGYIKSFSDGNYELWKIKQESFCYKFRQDVDLLLTYFEAPYQDKFDKIFEVRGSTPTSPQTLSFWRDIIRNIGCI